MIDRRTEEAIKAVTVFLEFWTEFHSIYTEIASKDIITQDDETKFLAAKEMMGKKYADLAGRLDCKYAPHGRLTDPVSDILGLDGIRFASEKNIRKTADDWRDSYVFLNSIAERLKSKKRRLGQFSPVGVFFKKRFGRKA